MAFIFAIKFVENGLYLYIVDHLAFLISAWTMHKKKFVCVFFFIQDIKKTQNKKQKAKKKIKLNTQS